MTTNYFQIGYSDYKIGKNATGRYCDDYDKGWIQAFKDLNGYWWDSTKKTVTAKGKK